MRSFESIRGPGSIQVHNSGNNPFFQPKITLSQSNDPLEQEADSIAEKVMHAPANQNHFFQSVSGTTQGKSESSQGEGNLQMKEATSRNKGIRVPSLVPEAIGSGGQPLDSETRNYFEPRFGQDFGNVRIHSGSLTNQSSSGIHALAYTQGNHIVFGEGQFRPDTDTGKTTVGP